MPTPSAHEAPGSVASSHSGSAGRLQIVGTGIRSISQATPEAVAAIGSATTVLFAASDALTAIWIRRLNSSAEPLPTYVQGQARRPIYELWVDRILAHLAAGERVCVVFYGHPGVFVYAGHTAIRRAREGGYAAEMIPGISAADCLYCDLGIDPARDGCQSFDATDFVRRRPRFDVQTSLILWQVAVTCEERYLGNSASSAGLRMLTEVLAYSYRPDHEVVLYEASRFGFTPARIEPLKLHDLPAARVSTASTLFVPPRAAAALAASGLADLSNAHGA